MKKLKNKFLWAMAFLCLLLIPLSNYAQDDPLANEPPPNQDAAKALDWAQGGPVFEDWFMDAFLTEYKNVVWGEFDTFINVATALAGCFMIVFFGIRSYGMMVGEQKWEILPLLRPFGLLMIILYWKSFVTMVSFPTDIMARMMKTKNDAQQEVVTNMRFIRHEYQKAMVDNLYMLAADAKLAAQEGEQLNEKWYEWIGRELKEGWNEVIAPAVAIQQKLELSLQLALTLGLESMALFILRIAVYAIFAIQIIYSGILIMLGPISVAASIIPAFRESFTTWLSRFISINLYLTIALIVMFVGGLFQEFALEAEVLRYKELVTRSGDLVANAESKLIWLTGNGIISFGMVIVTFLMTAVCMATVPSISTWIVNSAGATSAVSTMGRAGASVGGKLAMAGRLLMGGK